MFDSKIKCCYFKWHDVGFELPLDKKDLIVMTKYEDGIIMIKTGTYHDGRFWLDDEVPGYSRHPIYWGYADSLIKNIKDITI